MTDWIAGHWDSAGLRLWGMVEDSPTWDARSDVSALNQPEGGHAAALRAAIAPHLAEGAPCPPILLSGPVGAADGWHGAAQARLPCAPLAAGVTALPGAGPDLPVAFLGGLVQGSPPALLHGVEAPLAGFLSLNPGFDGVICLPGPVSVWTEVSAGEVISCRSFLSGDLVAALAAQGTLAGALTGPRAGTPDPEAFTTAVETTLSRPERLASELASLRAGALAGDAETRTRMEGLLIGAELAATRPYWLGRALAVIAPDAMARPTLAALSAQGLGALHADWAPMVLRGMAQARRSRA